jgi:hypothetical protein
MLPSLNLYAYCGDNPLAFVDPTGLDAIWINSSNYSGTLGQGHSSLLIENAEGKWKYFYFAINGVHFLEVAPAALKSLDAFNEWHNSKEKIKPYDSSVYIEGDFTDAYSVADNLGKDYKPDQIDDNTTLVDRFFYKAKNHILVNAFFNTAKNKEYSLFTNNCAIASWNLLKTGFLYDEEKTNVGEYMDSFSISPSFLPNKTSEQVSFIFANSSFTYDGLKGSIQETIDGYVSQKSGWADMQPIWNKLLNQKKPKIDNLKQAESISSLYS